MTLKLKPAIKKLWCDALNSGTYDQGFYNLQANGKFCCLGVLCELACTAMPDVIKKENYHGGVVLYRGSDTVLPGKVIKWAFEENSNIKGANAGLLNEPEYGFSSLLCLNDSSDFSFKQIAEIINRQF